MSAAGGEDDRTVMRARLEHYRRLLAKSKRGPTKAEKRLVERIDAVLSDAETKPSGAGPEALLEDLRSWKANPGGVFRVPPPADLSETIQLILKVHGGISLESR